MTETPEIKTEEVFSNSKKLRDSSRRLRDSREKKVPNLTSRTRLCSATLKCCLEISRVETSRLLRKERRESQWLWKNPQN